MTTKKTQTESNGPEHIIAEARRTRQLRKQAYREQTLKMYPHICARCGREFEGRKLRELTVHHKDHNHDNNPPDGSNWELLCLYCHDNEHQKYLEEEARGASVASDNRDKHATHKPFAALEALLKNKKE